MPVVLKQEPQSSVLQPAAAPDKSLSISETLDPGESIVSFTSLDLGAMPSDAMGMFIGIVIVYLILRFILSFIPKVVIAAVGVAILYTFLK
jgi:hypothetical protein